MSEQEEYILLLATHAGDDPEKAAIPFTISCAALAMDTKAIVVLQGNGVYLGLKGYVDTMLRGGGFPPVKKLMNDFLELGGELKVCAPCIKERNIDVSELVEGSTTIAGGELVVKSMEAKAVFTY
ncbi:MAG: multidrug transporter [Deltaproteobacteria bacterium]|nr:MAG: multidrug transporter [Deltaproteobacteria bacterium]